MLTEFSDYVNPTINMYIICLILKSKYKVAKKVKKLIIENAINVNIYNKCCTWNQAYTISQGLNTELI